MNFLGRKRDGLINKYLLLSQVLFFLLLGILVLRSANFTYETLFVKMSTVMVFAIILALVPFLQLLDLSSAKKQVVLDFIIIIIYLVAAAYLLAREEENLFKVILLMPAVVTAIKYGLKISLIAGAMSAMTLFYLTYANNFLSIDVVIMLGAVILLLAWLLGNMTDTERKIRTELERLANYDGLTDIYNHRSFQCLLDQELAKAKRGKTSVSLMLIDIDYFKYYNDAFGHQRGDAVLKEIAGIVKQVTAELGYCARYGGEEFAVILHGMDTEDAQKVGEEIRRSIEQTAFPGGEILPKGKLTVSIGIAGSVNAGSKEKIIQLADEALYKAKFISKNRVETYYSVFDDLNASLNNEGKELLNSIRTLITVVNAKDKYTYGHSLRTMEMAKMLSLKLGLDSQTVKDVSYGALLHDIGKIEIDREILNKFGRLSQQEWSILKQHPQWGADIIRPLDFLKETSNIILFHHENYDGSGYPFGKKGDAIPLGARILRIVDSFDAMTTIRSYKMALTKEEALAELQKYSGTHYDPGVLAEFCKMVGEDRAFSTN